MKAGGVQGYALRMGMGWGWRQMKEETQIRVQDRSKYEARRAEFTDGWDGMDGISKVSFKFLYTL